MEPELVLLRNNPNEALSLIEPTGEERCEPEMLRLKGELLLRMSTPDPLQAESRFRQALEIARRQQAKSWELRTACSLARLWQFNGKCQDAYSLVTSVYAWFTEGFDTADLQEAQAVLGELER